MTGYKVYVNGVVEAVLGPEQFTYTFTQGKWCKEYSFQVQVSTCTTGVISVNRLPTPSHRASGVKRTASKYR